MKKNLFFKLLFLLVCFFNVIHSEEELILRNNLQRAQPGDFLVTAQNKNYTMLLIRNKDTNTLNIEEITVPSQRVSKKSFSWRQWVEKGAPGHTCWIMYAVYLPTGTIQHTFSFTKNEWISIPQSQSFLSTLLNLPLKLIPPSERKKVGPKPHSDSQDRRSVWQPPLIVDGQKIPGVLFDGWRTHWPKDGTDLSGKLIEIYLPKENSTYPAYFPYWLQVSGFIGKAKVRIVDSGSQLESPARLPQQ